MSGSVSNLGNDSTLNPNGIDATGQMDDETIGPQDTTTFTVKITNNSATAVANYRVFVNVVAGGLTVFPDHIHFLQLQPGETEDAVFLVRNHTGAIQNAYTLGVRSNYFGAITHTYDNFVRP